jgi:hypothetical protein
MNLNETSALTLAKKAISLINNQTTQAYAVTKLLESRDNSAAAIYIHTNGGTEETIKIHADQGTSTSSVNVVSDVGGIKLYSGLNAANAVYVHANGGTAETVKIHADRGTSAADQNASVQLLSDAGGIGLYAGLNSANAIYIHANGGTTETIKIHSDIGIGAASINILSDAGGITLNASSAVAITNNATVGGTLEVTGNTTVGGTLGVIGNTTVGGTLGVTGNTTVGGTLGVIGTTTVDGTLGVTGDTTVGGTLGVTGTTTVDGTLGVTGNTTVGGTLGVTGNTTVGGTLGVTGALTHGVNVIKTSGATVLTSGQSGSIVLLTGEHIVTLPAVYSGGYYRIIVTGAGGGQSITCANPYIITFMGTTTCNDGTVVVDYDTNADTITITNKAVRGLTAECVCDGTNWFVNAIGTNVTDALSVFTIPT